MNSTPARSDVRAVLEALDWPAATIGGRLVHGEAQWSAVLPGLITPGQRLEVLRALRYRLLVSTDAGREHLRAWLDTPRGQALETLQARRARIRARLPIFGDGSLVSAIVAMVAALPGPVADYLAERCMVLVAGAEVLGWTAGRLPDRHPILLSAAGRSLSAIAGTLRHEAAHQFLIRFTRPAPSEDEQVAALADLLREGLPVDTLQRWDLEAEQLADWLAWSLEA